MEAMLDNMNTQYHEGNSDVKPNSSSYVALFRSYAKSQEPNGCKRAENLLRQLLRLYAQGDHELKPTTYCFNCVIQAFSNNGMKANLALKRIKGLIQEMEAMYESGNLHVKPDNFTYNLLLKVLAKSTLPNKAVCAQNILEKMEKKKSGRRCYC